MTNINLLNQLQMAHTIAWFTYSLFWQSSHCHDELDLHLLSWRRAKGWLPSHRRSAQPQCESSECHKGRIALDPIDVPSRSSGSHLPMSQQLPVLSLQRSPAISCLNWVACLRHHLLLITSVSDASEEMRARLLLSTSITPTETGVSVAPVPRYHLNGEALPS